MIVLVVVTSETWLLSSPVMVTISVTVFVDADLDTEDAFASEVVESEVASEVASEVDSDGCSSVDDLVDSFASVVSLALSSKALNASSSNGVRMASNVTPPSQLASIQTDQPLSDSGHAVNCQSFGGSSTEFLNKIWEPRKLSDSANCSPSLKRMPWVEYDVRMPPRKVKTHEFPGGKSKTPLPPDMQMVLLPTPRSSVVALRLNWAWQREQRESSNKTRSKTAKRM